MIDLLIEENALINDQDLTPSYCSFEILKEVAAREDKGEVIRRLIKTNIWLERDALKTARPSAGRYNLKYLKTIQYFTPIT
jgi:hypothetical protein